MSDLEFYVSKYITNRPGNARKIMALNRFICETKEITPMVGEYVATSADEAFTSEEKTEEELR